MKKILLLLILLSVGTFNGQTHSRKTRSDKGKKHSHSTSYRIKKALKPKSTHTTKKARKK